LASLWQQGRDGGTQAPPPPVWQGEGLLLTRPFMAVSSRALSLAGCTFMTACAQGLNVGEAALAALQAEPGCALQTLMASLLQSGAFCAIQLDTIERTS
ncbi:hypothetical protein, partial [Craterilacuibacter sp.]|uniref:hypothetical protein n=1 Tax=Craterilacuibacter sp. TaxID=2870909 RepID=UPI003F4138C6